jgi:signal transduction histidine kinase/CheY-like chemotaxis protein
VGLTDTYSLCSYISHLMRSSAGGSTCACPLNLTKGVDPLPHNVTTTTTSTDQDTGGPVVALLERKTSLIALGIGTVATLLVHIVETLTGTIAAHDRLGQPLLALALLGLFLRLRFKPETLLATQRMAVLTLQIYFTIGVIHLSVFNLEHVGPFWMATTYMWTILITLLLHITWPQRQALTWSVILLTIVSVPPVLRVRDLPLATWEADFLPLLINGILVHVAVLLSLLGVSRLRHGIMRILASDGPIGPAEARNALEQWMTDKTTALAEARDSAEAASRAKSQFLAVMSHELRTPLHAMLVSADLLAERPEGPLPEREARLVTTIRSSGKHLLALIDQVLDLSRIEAGKVTMVNEPLDVSSVCRRATEAVLPMTQTKGLTLTLLLDPALMLQRRGDALRLTQILINLLANACKFTERGGIQLKVQGHTADGVEFQVVDTGPGLSDEAQSHVFEAFYQADHDSTRRHGGVGLGLTITRELVDLMGGQLTLNSHEGVGTSVQFTIQMPPGPVVTPVEQPPQSQSASIEGARVLVVEDDPVNSMLACEVLQGAHAHAAAVESGESALAYLREHPVDLILMDFRMPGMDGLEATRRIRSGEAGPEARLLPVLGLTANAYLEDREQCLEAGMSDVLTKPIESRALVRAVALWRLKPVTS